LKSAKKDLVVYQRAQLLGLGPKKDVVVEEGTKGSAAAAGEGTHRVDDIP